MKLSALLAACLLTAAAALPATAHEVFFATTLNGATEISPVVSPGSGNVLVTVDLDLLTMRVQASFQGLLGTTTASHIHCCTLTPGAANAMVATNTPSFTGFPLGVTSGTFDHTFDMTLASSYNPAFVTAKGNISNAFTALLDGMASRNAYYNIHTTRFPGGEIRGLLQQVPEPDTYAMLLAGLAMTGWAAKRRNRI